MNKAANAPAEPSFEMRFCHVGLVQVRIRTTDAVAIKNELAARVLAAPQLFDRTAVCLDLSALDREPDVAGTKALLDAIREAGMLPVGLGYGTSQVDALARELGIPVLPQHRASNKPHGAPTPPPPVEAAPAPKAAAAPAEPIAMPSPSLMHHQVVRSGQRVYARDRDLVVTTTVGAGSEVIADGCVHIYGALRGRAVAGARGEVTARVFCQEFQAELVSIAGVFRVFETIPPELVGKPVQAWLDGDDLRFARVGA